MGLIYMDANATTPVVAEVVEAMRPWWGERFGNASSVHRRGQGARAAVERARESVAKMLGCRTAEVVFTSGGTESDNLALFGVMRPLLAAGERPHLVTTAMEHHAVLHAAEELERQGASVTYLAPDQRGLVSVEALREALRPETRLVSVMLANNETGVLQPIAELAATAHAVGALFHTDAVQGAGKVALDVRELGVDLLSVSGHKMYGPQGTGALFARKGVRLAPMFFGGAHERERRAGTENVPGIVGLGCAAGLEVCDLTGLRDRFEAGVLAEVACAGVNGAGVERVGNTSNLHFEGLDAEALVIALDLRGLAVSAGAACSSGATEPSHVLRAMGLGEARARGSVRFSLWKGNTVEEVELAAGLVVEVVARLRGVG